MSSFPQILIPKRLDARSYGATVKASTIRTVFLCILRLYSPATKSPKEAAQETTSMKKLKKPSPYKTFAALSPEEKEAVYQQLDDPKIALEVQAPESADEIALEKGQA